MNAEIGLSIVKLLNTKKLLKMEEATIDGSKEWLREVEVNHTQDTVLGGVEGQPHLKHHFMRQGFRKESESENVSHSLVTG